MPLDDIKNSIMNNLESYKKIETINKSDQLNQEFIDSIDLQMISPITNRYKAGYFNRFKRVPILDPYNIYDGAAEYVFFSKPDFPIFLDSGSSLSESLRDNPIFTYASHSYMDVLLELQSSASSMTHGSRGKLIPFLSNSLSSTLDLPDIDSDDVEGPQNVYGTKIYYRGNSAKSDEDFTFNLEFEDTKNSEVYMFFKLWDEFKRLDWEGAIDIPADSKWADYIVNKVLFDQITLFKIIVGSDGNTILFWGEVVGCYPKGVPRGAWGNPSSLNNYMKLTSSWRGHFVKDNNIISLIHLNKLTTGSPTIFKGPLVDIDLPMYNSYYQGTDRRWAGVPYICEAVNSNGLAHPYQLRWTV